MKKEKFGTIYMVRNKVNNKIYFGQTTDKNGFNRRYKNNIAKNSHNEHLKYAIKKYGIENFDIYKEFDVAYSKEELNKLEDMYIKLYNTTNPSYGYNKKFGGATNGKMSEETKKKMSEISKSLWKNEEYREKTMKGLKEMVTEDFKRKVSNAIRNSDKFRRAVTSKEFKEKQSVSKIEKWKGNEFRKKTIEGMKKSWTDEKRLKYSENAKKQHQESDFKKFISNNTKSLWQDEEQRKKMIEGMKKEYLVVDTKTGDFKTFKGRKALAEYINMSEAYVKKRLANKKLHQDRYLITRKSDYDIS